jgi:putative transposase
MAPRASAHAVYDLKYHFVWIPKYRHGILTGEVAATAEESLRRAAEAYDMEIDAMEVMADHVHLSILAPPRYSPARIAQILKSITAKELFRRHPWLR